MNDGFVKCLSTTWKNGDFMLKKAEENEELCVSNKGEAPAQALLTPEAGGETARARSLRREMGSDCRVARCDSPFPSRSMPTP